MVSLRWVRARGSYRRVRRELRRHGAARGRGRGFVASAAFFTSVLELLPKPLRTVFEPIQKWGMVHLLMYCSCTVSTGLYRFEHPCRASTLVAFAGRERVGKERKHLCVRDDVTAVHVQSPSVLPLSGPEDPQER